MVEPLVNLQGSEQLGVIGTNLCVCVCEGDESDTVDADRIQPTHTFDSKYGNKYILFV